MDYADAYNNLADDIRTKAKSTVKRHGALGTKPLGLDKKAVEDENITLKYLNLVGGMFPEKEEPTELAPEESQRPPEGKDVVDLSKSRPKGKFDPSEGDYKAVGKSGNGRITKGIVEAASALDMDPELLATIISYETAGTFNPTKKGPTTKWGQHKGFIQFGETQAREYGVDFSNTDTAIDSQLGSDGAIVKYFLNRGWQPGMSDVDAYSIVNAGSPGLGHLTDENAGGAKGTVSNKVYNQFAPHRRKAKALIETWS